MDYKQDYYVGEAHKQLVRNKKRAELFVEAWQKVERIHKKDGTDFANISKNFNNLSITADNLIGNKGSVYTYSDELGHDSDKIDLYLCLPTYSEERKKYENTGRIIDGGVCVDYVVLTADEIMEKVAERIKYWQGVVATNELALAEFDKIAKRLFDMRETAKTYIETLPEKYVFRSILLEER